MSASRSPGRHGSIPRRMVRVVAIPGLVLGIACSANDGRKTVERPLPPHPTAETVTGPIVGLRRTEHGVQSGTVAFRSEIQFDAPNHFNETIHFEGIDDPVATSWDGERFSRYLYREVGMGLLRLQGDEARAVFDRALEEALLTRQYESEPSLVVHPLPALTDFHGTAATTFEVSHAPSGFARILYFAQSDGRLLGWTGQRWKPSGGPPVEYEVRFLAHDMFDGRQFPTRYEAYEAGVRTVEATIDSASLISPPVVPTDPEAGR